MKFIHAADLHIDSPLRGLDRYEGAPVDRLRGATRKAFEQLVDLAMDEKIDFLLLAGDIYDGDWQDFHTGLYFREQMVRLGRSNIPVFIAHGNHDAQSIISRQLDLPSHVTVFSSRTAETVQLDELSVAIHGRSFPNRAVDEDLVPDYPEPVPGYFNIGVLHTSLAGRSGHDTYAPTDTAILTAKGYDYWALGHIHMRETVSENPRIVFPGNLQGRHAKETGAKGCELVTVEAGTIIAEFMPLDVVRWNQLTVPLDGIEKLELVGAAFRKMLNPLLLGANDRLHAVRVLLTGSTHLHGVEANKPGTLDAAIRGAAQDVDEAEVWIEQVKLSLATPLDRVLAAEREDAIGELIRLVDAIGVDEEALKSLMQVELGSLLD
ncbi:MAG: DNA repair exonuclease [Mariprofundaceae bacterium]